MEENKYKAALERAKSAIKECGGNVGRIKMIESIFPELAGDMDEQSRKWILEYLYDGLRKADKQFEGQFKAAIAYLEKLEDIDKRLEVQYKRGYGKGYVDGMADAKKKELEKQGKHKFNIGDTISNGDIEYRVVDIVKNCVYNDCYSLRRAGKIEEPFLWDCEEADKLFEKL